MSKFIRFINQSIKHFFIIDGEVLDDGCNEFKNGLPDFFTDSQFVTVFGSLSVPPWRRVSFLFCFAVAMCQSCFLWALIPSKSGGSRCCASRRGSRFRWRCCSRRPS